MLGNLLHLKFEDCVIIHQDISQIQIKSYKLKDYKMHRKMFKDHGSSELFDALDSGKTATAIGTASTGWHCCLYVGRNS
jgi:hypothetical protein